ncbi:hypothetical protein L195_g015116 [Trifolium pratense]|uniref:Tesmin/TSO1-like CXC domain-containing protein n=1 Tax=Trifolium pratense TaxID=57577 RepID=A0A2K3MMF1_TRIPR|nr:hypothetical protein L195_g015116 [Trifolium pratense]
MKTPTNSNLEEEVPKPQEEPLLPNLNEEPLLPNLNEEQLLPNLNEETLLPKLNEEPLLPNLNEEPEIPDMVPASRKRHINPNESPSNSTDGSKCVKLSNPEIPSTSSTVQQNPPPRVAESMEIQCDCMLRQCASIGCRCRKHGVYCSSRCTCTKCQNTPETLQLSSTLLPSSRQQHSPPQVPTSTERHLGPFAIDIHATKYSTELFVPKVVNVEHQGVRKRPVRAMLLTPTAEKKLANVEIVGIMRTPTKLQLQSYRKLVTAFFQDAIINIAHVLRIVLVAPQVVNVKVAKMHMVEGTVHLKQI